MSDYDALVAMLTRFAEESRTRSLTLGEALDSLDEAAYAFITLILVLPFLQPIPLGPLTVVGGLTFAALGWQLWRGHESPVLPQKIRAVVMSEKSWHILVKVCLKVVSFCRKFTRPRYMQLVKNRRGQKIGGFILLSAGLLMAIPLPGLPLNNFLPGLAILFYCFGELEEDGLMILIAFVWLIISVVYFALFFYGLEHLGAFALSHYW